MKTLLEDRMELPELPGTLTSVSVTISTPGSEQQNGHDDGQDIKTPRINLFLYRVTENGHLKNQEIPGHDVPGAYGHPPLSLDLYYVLTAYGMTTAVEGNPGDETIAHYLLGSALRVLHDHPVITKQLRTVRAPAGRRVLDQTLTQEFERVKLYLDPISLEDLSKIWTALMLSYRLSVAYKVTVVQIESQRSTHLPRPVGEPPAGGPRVYAVPFRSPQIQELLVRRTDNPDVERPLPYARVGDTLVIRGRNFRREPAKVLLGSLQIPIAPHSDDHIELGIPDDTLADDTIIPEERRLQPGAHPVSVVSIMPELPQTGFYSNQAVFMLVPLITEEPDLNAVPRTLRIRGKRLYLGTLSGETLVGPALIGKSSYSSASPTEITVPLPDTLPARLVRCLASDDLSAFPDLPSPPLEIQVSIGDGGTPHTATLIDKPNTLEGAADLLQAAIRGAAGGSTAFEGTRITVAGNGLAVVPGGLFDTVTISGSVADQLKLSASGQAKQFEGAYLSGELAPFPVLTAAEPSLRVTIGNATHTVRLTSRPTTLVDAADKLQSAIRNKAETGFSEARVAVLGNQLLILPGVPEDSTNFESVPVEDQTVPGGDQTTAAELQLRARYQVRVRVNGAESIDNKGLVMPETPP